MSTRSGLVPPANAAVVGLLSEITTAERLLFGIIGIAFLTMLGEFSAEAPVALLGWVVLRPVRRCFPDEEPGDRAIMLAGGVVVAGALAAGCVLLR